MSRVPSWYVTDVLARLAGELHAMSKPGARMPNKRPMGVGEWRAWAQRWCLPLDTVVGLLGADHREAHALSLEDVDELLEVVTFTADLGVEYGFLPRLRELRTALADAMERYEGEAT